MKTKITNISDYIQNICMLNEDVYKMSYFYNNELLFRGQANIEYELLPSIGRNRNFVCDKILINKRKRLSENRSGRAFVLFSDSFFIGLKLKNR